MMIYSPTTQDSKLPKYKNNVTLRDKKRGGSNQCVLLPEEDHLSDAWRARGDPKLIPVAFAVHLHELNFTPWNRLGEIMWSPAM